MERKTKKDQEIDMKIMAAALTGGGPRIVEEASIKDPLEELLEV